VNLACLNLGLASLDTIPSFRRDRTSVRNLGIFWLALGIIDMRATFVEMPPFMRHRDEYLDDRAYRQLQLELMKHPEAGDVIAGTGGLRKLRFSDRTRGKGKRGGLRVIYYWRIAADQFWLFTLYDKDEAADLTVSERRALGALLMREIEARNKK
jgi:hypothetical protein